MTKRFLLKLYLLSLYLYSGLVVALSGQSLGGAELGLSFEHIFDKPSIRDKPNFHIESGLQDRHGFMWFGGVDGIFRYDGRQAKFYDDESDNVCTRLISGMVIDHDGVLWVSTIRALCRYNEDFDRFDHFGLPGKGMASPYTSIAVSPRNELYLGGLGRLAIINPERKQLQRFNFQAGENFDNSSNDFQDIRFESADLAWIGTRASGLVRFSTDNKQFTPFSADKTRDDWYTSNDIRSLQVDPLGQIWFSSPGFGIGLLNKERNSVERFDRMDTLEKPVKTVWQILIDSVGLIWFASDGQGLVRYDPITQRIDQFLHRSDDPNSLRYDKTGCIVEDANQNIWLSGFPLGLEFFDRKQERIQRYRHLAGIEGTLNDSSILKVFEDSKHRVWVGTEAGLNLFDSEKRQYISLSHENNYGWQIPVMAVNEIVEDINGDLLLGTWANGFFRIDLENANVQQFMPTGSNDSINSDTVWSIVPEEDEIWLATQRGGVNIYNRDSQSFRYLNYSEDRPNGLRNNLIFKLLPDTNHKYWVASIGGLSLYDSSDDSYKHFSDSESPVGFSIPSTNIRSLFRDSNQGLWVGTEDQGLFYQDPSTKLFRAIGQSRAHRSANVTGILEDPSGDIWALATIGLLKVDSQRQSIKLYEEQHGLVSDNIYRGAGYIDANGTAYIGGSDGLSVFDYRSLGVSGEEFPLEFISFKILNTEVSVGEEFGPLRQSILKSKNIELTHAHSMFSLGFAALNYPKSEYNRYAYKLEGFDKQWHFMGELNSATYTNVPSGSYTFHVKASNYLGEWSEFSKTLGITVLPPPWKSWWAYSLYILFVLSLFLFSLLYNIRKVNYETERELNSQLLKLNESKDAFLANTSHELRTPLNGVIGLANSLMDESNENDRRRKAELIVSTCRRLSLLVNDILDYSKLLDSKLELYKSWIDLNSLIDDVFSMVDPLAKDKNITLVNSANPLANWIYADENRLQQILINLVSNGVKYSHEGQVTVASQIRGDEFIIDVIDSGIGIEQSKIESIFMPFNQLDSAAVYRSGGTGLGLSVTRNLIELHGGSIYVNSVLDQGSCFSVTLPFDEFEAAKQKGVSYDEVEPAQQVTIAIADDDPVNRMILGELLRQNGYRVVDVNGGGKAIEVCCKTHKIDLLLLDIHMPDVDGYHACSKIRVTHSAESLPVIFLTANISDEDRNKTRALHAYDILLKPTPNNQLLQVVRSALNTRRQDS
ncbi:MAG: two-component system sensor histidine kinase ChiS [Flavobacteriales bacterium]|jgi:two-component system sensor histidine kinase ChiS